MKKIALLILLFSFSSLCYSQAKFETPPGTIFLKDSIYIDRTPVTNRMFLEYLTAKNDLRKKGFTSFKEYHTTEDKILNRLIILYPSYLKNLDREGSLLTKKNYFENTKFESSPVLNISKEQAEDYCNWRTEMVTYLWLKNNIVENQKIAYRLPTKKELATSKEIFTEKKLFSFYDGKDPSRFKPYSTQDNFALFNISEYTSSENVYGENWRSVTPLEFPNDVTGFRCACESY